MPTAKKDYIEYALTPELKMAQAHNELEGSLRTFKRGDLYIMVAWGGRWHLSISCDERDPTWEEIRDARYALLPDKSTMALFLPPKSEYVNLHEHCYHMWEVKGE
jgi:hypothetical protein